MARSIPPPDDVTLLPQLLACLPGSTLPNSQPPPAILPLLSPILRQRVQLLSTPSDRQSSWLPLLCWEQHLAARLPSVVEGLDIEPHPVSGEIEPPEVESVSYRRSDTETLHARLPLPSFNLLPIYLWCTGDTQTGDGWRIAELRPLEDSYTEDTNSGWYDSIERADDGWTKRLENPSTNGLTTASETQRRGQAESQNAEDNDDDDGSYWAMYDRTPGRTPKRPSPAPGPTDSAVHLPTTSEMAYFARYAAEVQPAMDPHDPSEEQPGTESTLNGTTLNLPPHDGARSSEEIRATTSQSNAVLDATPDTIRNTQTAELSQPRPTSPSDSSTTNSVVHLERAAAKQSHAEVGVKQHISTSIKSLYRLANAAGIEQAEFERIVRTELDVLSMLNLEED